MENILPRVMCKCKENMNTALSLMIMVLYELFSGQKNYLVTFVLRSFYFAGVRSSQ